MRERETEYDREREKETDRERETMIERLSMTEQQKESVNTDAVRRENRVRIERNKKR